MCVCVLCVCVVCVCVCVLLTHLPSHIHLCSFLLIVHHCLLQLGKFNLCIHCVHGLQHTYICMCTHTHGRTSTVQGARKGHMGRDILSSWSIAEWIRHIHACKQSLPPILLNKQCWGKALTPTHMYIYVCMCIHLYTQTTLHLRSHTLVVLAMACAIEACVDIVFIWCPVAVIFAPVPMILAFCFLTWTNCLA